MRGLFVLYDYQLYGLKTKSEIALPEAYPVCINGLPDVTIRCGGISIDASSHPNSVHPTEKWWYYFLSNRHMIYTSGRATFEILDGRQIVVNQHIGDVDSDSRIQLLGTAFGVLQMQRGDIPMHGGTILYGGGAMVICGPVGAGKSTLISAMVEEGFSFLADDVSTMSSAGETIKIMPAYPQRKLKADACDSLGVNVGELEKMAEESMKYAVRDLDAWHSEPVELRCFVEVLKTKREHPELQPLSGHEKLKALMRNLYRYPFYRTTGIEPALMKRLLEVASKTDIYQLFRPDDHLTVKESVVLLKTIRY